MRPELTQADIHASQAGVHVASKIAQTSVIDENADQYDKHRRCGIERDRQDLGVVHSNYVSLSLAGFLSRVARRLSPRLGRVTGVHHATHKSVIIVIMRALQLAAMLCALGWSAPAQFPGQYPGQYPPGQYPGRYPPGSYPPNGQPQSSGGPGRAGRNAPRNSKAAPITATTTGWFRVSAGSQFVIEAEDHRVITYRTSSQTTVQRSGKDVDIASFTPGDHLSVDATEDDMGFFTAVAVRFEKAGTPAERAAASETEDLPKLSGVRSRSSASSPPSAPEREPGDDRPILRRKNNDDSSQPASSDAAPTQTASGTGPAAPAADDPVDTRPTTTMRPADPARDSDDPGPPSLRRGTPQPKLGPPPSTASSRSGESSGGPVILAKGSEPAPSASGPASILAAPADDPVIEKAREVVANFAGALLPNFFCQQVTTRYATEHPKQGWDALDVVTADVAYEDGRETYKNIKVGNKAVSKSMDDLEGTRSTGEFASLELDLLAPDTAATFRKSGQDTIHGRQTWVYKFEVPRERSHWRVEVAAQLYYPAYQGTVWIDRETSRLLRIEQQARNMPVLFPFDTVETAADYDFVRLSTPDAFLLPVNAEVLSCERGTSHCSRNRIEFRNYRKFSTDANITFGN